MIKDSRLKSIIEIIWIVIVLIAGGYYIAKNFETVKGYFTSLPIILPIISFLLIALSKIILARLAQLSFEFSDIEFTFPEMFNIVTVTQLGKYLPGGIWHFVGRFGAYQQRGIDKVQNGKLMLLENLWLVISALGIGLILLQLSGPEILTLLLGQYMSWRWLIWVLILGLFAAMGIVPYILFKRRKNLLYWLRITLLVTIIWVSYGISYAILLDTLTLNQFIAMASSFDLSWVGGYLTVFAPAGIGVREVILSLFATALLIEEGAVISVFHRLIWTAVEIILGLVSMLLKRVNKNESHHPDSLPE